jgi:aerobic-type carbon monoxide dehydrogenase small subunit (CoxS/CutS family)
MKICFVLNGRDVEIEASATTSLLSVLRQQCEIYSVRETCGIGVCGACTALVDGVPISTCIQLAPMAAGCDVVTAEGLAEDDPVVAAFADARAFQCGFCTPGFVLTVKHLLEENPQPTDPESRLALAGNLCRCGSYLNILAAVQRASKEHDP